MANRNGTFCLADVSKSIASAGAYATLSFITRWANAQWTVDFVDDQPLATQFLAGRSESAIGVMEPRGTSEFCAAVGKAIFARVDVEALDLIGWNVDPDAVQYAASTNVNLIGPAANSSVPSSSTITFQWEPSPVLNWTVMIYQGAEIADSENPYRVYYELPGSSTSKVIEEADSLPPGEYVWLIWGRTDCCDLLSEERRLTILPACDPDINCDGNADQEDVSCLINVVAGNPGCECGDTDFNHDGNLDQADVALLLDVVAGSPCP